MVTTTSNARSFCFVNLLVIIVLDDPVLYTVLLVGIIYIIPTPTEPHTFIHADATRPISARPWRRVLTAERILRPNDTRLTSPASPTTDINLLTVRIAFLVHRSPRRTDPHHMPRLAPAAQSARRRRQCDVPPDQHAVSAAPWLRL